MSTDTLERTSDVVKASPAVKRSSAHRTWLAERLTKGKNKVFTEKVRVTPELAIILLEANKDNRKIRPSKLAQFKADMNANRWEFNGETVKFANSGELNDGQHRLQAIVETNKPQDLLICFGVERKSRLTVDTGAARSASDHLTVSGWPYAGTMASVARMTMGFERMNKEALGRPSDLSTTEVLDRVSNDPLIQEVGTYAALNAVKFRSIAKTSILGFVYYQFAKKRPKEALTFMEKVKTGADLPESSPIRLLREKLINSPRYTTINKVEAFFRAWNAWITDQTISRINVISKLPPIEG
jgi:hypothetical protein